MKQLLMKNTILAIFVAFLATIIVIFPSAPKASAACNPFIGIPCIDAGNGGGSGSGNGGGRDPGGAGGNGGGGSGVIAPPPPDPDITRWVYESRTVDFRVPNGSIPKYIRNAATSTCTPNSADPSAPIGASVRTRYLYNETNQAIVTGSHAVWGTPTCIVLNYWDEALKCYIKADVNIDKVEGGNNRRLETQTVNTSWLGNGATGTYNQCINSNRVVISLSAPITEYGRYTADSTVYYTTIQVRHVAKDPINGNAAYDKILSYDNTVRTNTNYNYAQLTCYGFNINTNKNSAWTGSGWSWTETDCGPAQTTNPPTYQCVEPDVTIDGLPYTKGSLFEIFRDNEKHFIDWGNPSLILTSGGVVTITGTETAFRHAGTPVISNVTLSQDSKEIVLNSKKASTWMSGVGASADLQARWSTDRNSSLVISPVYRYSIRWMDTGVSIVSLNPFTGEVVYGSYAFERNSTAECAGASVGLNVLRTVNNG